MVFNALCPQWLGLCLQSDPMPVPLSLAICADLLASVSLCIFLAVLLLHCVQILRLSLLALQGFGIPGGSRQLQSRQKQKDRMETGL
jgi:hypothetical protein